MLLKYINKIATLLFYVPHAMPAAVATNWVLSAVLLWKMNFLTYYQV